jgi:exopolyphosphatase/pppGpp-phosphohydrolase
LLAQSPTAMRAKIPGLATDRVDSIVGGSEAVRALMVHAAARSTTVSSHGLREGTALHLLNGL